MAGARGRQKGRGLIDGGLEERKEWREGVCAYQYSVQVGQVRVRFPTSLKRARVETPGH